MTIYALEASAKPCPDAPPDDKRKQLASYGWPYEQIDGTSARQPVGGSDRRSICAIHGWRE